MNKPGILSRLFRPSTKGLADLGPEVWGFFGLAAPASGITLSPAQALRVPAVASAVRLISDAAAILPCRVMERQADGTEKEAPGHAANALLQVRANDWTTPFELIRDLVIDALTDDRGGLAMFVTSTGTMDKVSSTAREHIAGLADLIGAVRLPESSMSSTAGTDVVVDILVFQRRPEGNAPQGPAWMGLRGFPASSAMKGSLNCSMPRSISTLVIRRIFCSRRSRRRPGVATTISTPALRATTCPVLM